MIIFNEERKMFHLKTKNTSYIFGFYKDLFLLHLYWGKKIDGDIPDYSRFISESHRRRNSIHWTDNKAYGITYRAYQIYLVGSFFCSQIYP